MFFAFIATKAAERNAVSARSACLNYISYVTILQMSSIIPIIVYVQLEALETCEEIVLISKCFCFYIFTLSSSL